MPRPPPNSRMKGRIETAASEQKLSKTDLKLWRRASFDRDFARSAGLPRGRFGGNRLRRHVLARQDLRLEPSTHGHLQRRARYRHENSPVAHLLGDVRAIAVAFPHPDHLRDFRGIVPIELMASETTELGIARRVVPDLCESAAKLKFLSNAPPACLFQGLPGSLCRPPLRLADLLFARRRRRRGRRRRSLCFSIRSNAAVASLT